MSAVALLEAYIKDLNGCVSSGNAQSIYDPNSLATDIATQVLSEISTDDYGNVLHCNQHEIILSST
jgi:hypothetical protein